MSTRPYSVAEALIQENDTLRAENERLRDALARCAEEAEHPWSLDDEANQEGARTIARIARAALGGKS